MNEPGPLTSEARRISRPVFVSYATADRKQALSVCKAIERRGTKCWISTRDVEPGENYQEAIVRAIRDARAMVLVFSGAANNSDEIKKELSLASRHHVPVMALRIEDVEPSDAFAYELSTRQWIDAFEGWDNSLDALNARLQQIAGETQLGGGATQLHKVRRASMFPRRSLIAAASLALLLVGGVAGWLLLRPNAAPAHVMLVRLTGFGRLSSDLPSTMSDAVRDELVSAFPQDGSVIVSTASAPPTGTSPAYAIGGTLRHDGDTVRAIVRLTDERTGSTIWSSNFDYPATSMEKIPRWFAVNAAEVTKCALSAASTYPKVLPQKTLTQLFGLCAADSGPKAVDAARLVVQTTPDFSAGWSALAFTALRWSQATDSQRDSLRKESWQATEKAIQLDPQNAQAYVVQSLEIPHSELLRREALLNKAIKARPLSCGCEHHHFYGWLLWEVGRVHEAGQELFRAVGQEPLAPDTRVSLAETLMLEHFNAEAEEQYKAAADMVPDPESSEIQKLWSAPITGDYAGALAIVSAGRIKWIPPEDRTAMVASYKAIISGNPISKRDAAAALEALPEEHKTYITVLLLGALGANGDALRQIQTWDAEGKTVRGRLFLWYPSMRGVISDPNFPAVAERMGLINYWKTTHTKPDVCAAKDPPPFCGMI
ncbi:MAG: TIR domain-containing protein [Sphingomicrobium sp.]